MASTGQTSPILHFECTRVTFTRAESLLPLVAYWPKGISDKNGLRHDQSHLIDIMSTCVELAKAGYPKEYQGETITPMEGMSLVPIFDGQGPGTPLPPMGTQREPCC